MERLYDGTPRLVRGALNREGPEDDEPDASE
jgi:hypothetical protein